LSESLTKHINEYVDRRGTSFKHFVEFMTDPNIPPSSEKKAWSVVRRYCSRYIGLDRLLFFSVKWAKTGRIFDKTVTQLHICILMLQLGLNHLPCEALEGVGYWLDAIELVPDEEFSPIIMEHQHGGIGKKFLQFLEYLASRQFEILQSLDFSQPNMGYDSIFQQKQWLALHKFALETYHEIAFTFRFNSLPATSEQRKHFSDYLTLDSVQESDPFVIEVPKHFCNQIVRDKELPKKVCKVTGCKNVVFRELPPFIGSSSIRLIVSALGSMNAINKLRGMLSVKPDLSLADTTTDDPESRKYRLMCKLLADGVYLKLMEMGDKGVTDDNSPPMDLPVDHVME